MIFLSEKVVVIRIEIDLTIQHLRHSVHLQGPKGSPERMALLRQHWAVKTIEHQLKNIAFKGRIGELRLRSKDEMDRLSFHKS
jgi:hypothetical protein